jgi:hypothetical protein
MKRNVTLTVTTLLSVVLFSMHLADDIVRGIEPGTLTNYPGVLIMLVWVCGALLLADRRSGHVIMLLGGLLAAVVPVLHMRGTGVGGAFARSSGAFLFIWTLLALGVIGLCSVLLAIRGLWDLRSGTTR